MIAYLIKIITSTFGGLFRQYKSVPFLISNTRFGPFTLIRLLSAPVKSKVSSFSMGVEGVGSFGALQSFQTLLFSVGCFGLAAGTTAEISRANKSGNQTEVNKILGTVFATLLGASVVLIVAIAILANYISIWLYGTGEMSIYLLLPALALPFFSIANCYLEPILYGFARDDIAARAYKWSSIFDAIQFVALVLCMGVKGAALSLLFSPLFACIVLAVLVKSNFKEVCLFRLNFELKLLPTLLKTGLTMLICGASIYGAGLAVRSFIINNLGELANGHYQVALALSAVYMPFVSNAIWVRLYPTVGGTGLSSEGFLELVESVLWTAILSASMQIILLVSPDLLIKILYNEKFTPAGLILPWRLLGDFFFLVSQPIMSVLLALKLRRIYLLLSAATQIIFIFSAYEMSRRGLQAVVISYAITNAIIAIFCGFWFWRQFNYQQNLKSYRQVIFGWIFVVFILLVGQVFLANENYEWVTRLVPPLIFGVFFLIVLRAKQWTDLRNLRDLIEKNKVL